MSAASLAAERQPIAIQMPNFIRRLGFDSSRARHAIRPHTESQSVTG